MNDACAAYNHNAYASRARTLRIRDSFTSSAVRAVPPDGPPPGKEYGMRERMIMLAGVVSPFEVGSLKNVTVIAIVDDAGESYIVEPCGLGMLLFSHIDRRVSVFGKTWKSDGARFIHIQDALFNLSGPDGQKVGRQESGASNRPQPREKCANDKA